MTTNLEFSRWIEVFGDATLTGAMLDRLTHHAHILVFNSKKASAASQPLLRLNENRVVKPSVINMDPSTLGFIGDAEEKPERKILLSSVVSPKTDVLKVGHHVSSTSTSNQFLQAVAPKHAVISCGVGAKEGSGTQEFLVKQRHARQGILPLGRKYPFMQRLWNSAERTGVLPSLRLQSVKAVSSIFP